MTAIRCDLCERDLEAGGLWLMLNRYGVCERDYVAPREPLSRGYEGDAPQKEYGWAFERDADGDLEMVEDEDAGCSGIALCWPVCVNAWIEAEFVEMQAGMKKEEDDQ